MSFNRIGKDVKAPVLSQDPSISITIDQSLRDHFVQNLAPADAAAVPEDAITNLVAMILDNSEFPIEAKITGEGEIRIGYHLRSFSRPIFWS